MTTALAAVRAVMQEVTAVTKDDQFNGGQTRYAYRGVDRVVRAISASMRKHGLVIVPTARALPEYVQVTTTNGKPSNMVRVLVTYTVYGPDDDSYFEVTVPGEAMDSSDKAVSKAMSVAWRTMLLQTFFLPTEEPDPDSERQELGGNGYHVPERPLHVNRETGFKGTSAAAQERLEKYDQAVADWTAKIEEVKGDYQGLRNLYTEAYGKRVHRDILKLIMDAGNKVNPSG